MFFPFRVQCFIQDDRERLNFPILNSAPGELTLLPLELPLCHSITESSMNHIKILQVFICHMPTSSGAQLKLEKSLLQCYGAFSVLPVQGFGFLFLFLK